MEERGWGFSKANEVENSEPFSGPQPIRGKIMWPLGAGKWPLIYSLAKCYCSYPPVKMLR